MYVVIDTNIQVRSYFMTTNAFRLLLRASSDGRVALAVPEVVFQETITKYEEACRKGIATLRRARKELGMLQVPGHREIPTAIQTLEAREVYEKQLLEMIKGAMGELIPLPTVEHQKLVTKALARRKPFKNSGEGYRDALIWETVLQLAADDDVAFVSANSSDFAKRGLRNSLAPELEEEVNRAGGKRVTLYRDLELLIAELVPVADDPLEDLKERLQRGPRFQEGLAERIGLSIEPFTSIGSGSVESAYEPDIDLKVGGENPSITWVQDVRDIELEDGRLLDDNSLLFTISAIVEAEIESYVNKAEAYTLEDDPDVSIADWDWNDHYVLAKTTRELNVTCEGTYLMREGEISNLEVVSASA